MKYVPKKIVENVNVSKTSPIGELITLLGGALIIIIFIYFISGLILDYIIIPNTSADMEKFIGEFYKNHHLIKSSQTLSQTPAHDKINTIFNKLIDNIPDKKMDYKIFICPKTELNAFAIPARNIVLTSGLVEKADTENEVAFVIAHELGHLEKKHSLKSMGRGLILLSISFISFGQENDVTKVLSNSLSGVNKKYSQSQETEADLYAVELLNKTYGHIGGTTAFFERIEKEYYFPEFTYFFEIHPHPKTRIKVIKNFIQNNKLQEGSILPIKITSEMLSDIKKENK